MFDFTTNQSVEDINTVPEQFRGAYTKADGEEVYTIAESAAGLIESITGLSKSLTASRKEAKGYKANAVDPKALFSAIGEGTFEDADGVNAHIASLNEALEAAGNGKINLDKIRTDSAAAIQKVKDEAAAENALMVKSLEKYMVKASAATAVATAKGNSKLLMPHIEASARVVKEGDEYVTRILDGDGDYRTNGSGGFMGVEDLVAELKSSPDFAACFESDTAPGMGKQPGTSKKPAARQTSTEMTSREKIAQGLKDRQK